MIPGVSWYLVSSVLHGSGVDETFLKTCFAQWLGFASRLGVLLDIWLIESSVAVGESGGDGAHGFSRNFVASEAELAVEPSGDKGLCRSYDFGCFITALVGVTLKELPREGARGRETDVLFCDLSRVATAVGVTGLPGKCCGRGDRLACMPRISSAYFSTVGVVA